MIGSDGWNGYEEKREQNTPPMDNDPMERVGDDGENLANLASIFGFVSLITTVLMFPYLPYIFAPISIVFALIAQGRQRRLPIKCRRAIMLSTIALVANTVIMGNTLYKLATDADLRKDVNAIMQEMYGTNLDETFSELEALFSEMKEAAELPVLPAADSLLPGAPEWNIEIVEIEEDAVV